MDVCKWVLLPCASLNLGFINVKTITLCEKFPLVGVVMTPQTKGDIYRRFRLEKKKIPFDTQVFERAEPYKTTEGRLMQ